MEQGELMEGKNFKSDSYVIREAETIIKNYIRERQISDIQNFYQLKAKYVRLKILTIAISIVLGMSLLFPMLFQ